jgi:hypothetical protein
MGGAVTRRRFLATTALAGLGAGATFFLGRHAALALTPAPRNAAAEALYLQACGNRDGAYHKQLVAEVKERLHGQVGDAEIEAAIAKMSCPVCGCPITTF